MQDTVVQRLLELKLVNEQQIADAERLQKTGGGSISSNLVKLGAIAEKEFQESVRTGWTPYNPYNP